MKRAVAVASAAVLVLAGAVCVHLWSVATDASGTADRAPRRASRQPRAGGLAEGEVASSGGALAIRGRVSGPAGPVAGAVVVAFAPVEEREDPLVRQLCQPEEEERAPLDACDSDEASAAWAEAFAARSLEQPALARATTDAEGRFSLEGLAPGRYDVWAEREGGFATQVGLEAPTEALELSLEPGVMIEGHVEVNGAAPAAPLLVSGIALGFPRIFEAQTADEGRFTLGPLPAASYAVVSTSLEGHLGAHEVLDELGEEGETDALLELSSPRRISGVVLEDGRPAPGAELSLEGVSSEQEVVSDASGRFAFDNLRPGDYEVHGTLRYAAGVVPVLVPEGRDPEEVTLDLEPTGRVQGLVRDEAGHPVEGATVLLAGREPVTTEADGRFELSFGGGDERLIARAEGYLIVDEELSVPLGATLERNITLQRATLLRGTVVDEVGQPVPRASVSVEDESSVHDSGTSTDDNGAFALEAEAGASVEVEVHASGYVPVRRTLSAAAAERIVLQRGATLSVRLVDSNGQVVPEASVLATPLRGESGARTLVARRTEPGQYQLSGLVAGEYRVNARTEATAVEQLVRSDGRGPGHVEVTLPVEGEISGSVVGTGGQPVSEAYVRAVELQGGGRRRGAAVARTDEQGQFTLPAARGHRYELIVMKDSRPMVADELSAIADGPPLKIVLRDPAKVRGRVLYPDGAPASLFSVNGERHRAADGRFEEEVIPGVRLFRLSAPGFASQVRRLSVRDGESVDLGDIQLGEGRTLRVRVVDAQTGAPVRGASVRVTGASVSDDEDEIYTPDDPSRRTRSDGIAELHHVPDRASLEVEAAGYQTTTMEAGPESSALVRLEPHGALRVFVDDPFEGPLWASVEGTDDRLVPLDPIAGATFQALPPGEYLISVWRSPPPSDRRMAGTLAAVQPVEIRFPLEGTNEVHLRLRSSGSDVSVQLSGQAADGDSTVMLVPSKVDIAALTLDKVREQVAQLLLPERPGQRGPALFRNVPEGSYRVAVMLFGYRMRGVYVDPRPVEARAGGGTREVQVSIPDSWQPEDDLPPPPP